MYLYLDTRDSSRSTLGAVERQGVFATRVQLPDIHIGAGKLLSIIRKLERELPHKSKLWEGIIVEDGPGGFSSLRSGVILANTLAFSLDLPVYTVRSPQGTIASQVAVKKALKGTKRNKLVLPHYGSEPSITKPGKKR